MALVFIAFVGRPQPPVYGDRGLASDAAPSPRLWHVLRRVLCSVLWHVLSSGAARAGVTRRTGRGEGLGCPCGTGSGGLFQGLGLEQVIVSDEARVLLYDDK